MTNNLNVLKKELKSFAKRVKDFKYTDSALIAFLLTGIIGTVSVSLNLYSAEDQIKKQAEAINSSMTHLKGDIKQARQNNKKILRNENLELIQLMEQGDHVVKSPWSSWQYGINGFYNDWRGNYKGRGDKVEDVKYKRNKSMSVNKYETHPHTLYGSTTELGMKQEPNAMIPVSATLVPLTPTPKNADISMNVDISDLPSFNPRTVKAPKSPDVNTEVEVTAPTFSLVGESFANYGERFFDVASDKLIRIKETAGVIDFELDGKGKYISENGGGVIESVAVLKGNFVTERVQSLPTDQHYTFGDNYRHGGMWKYAYNDYTLANVFSDLVQTDNQAIINSMKTDSDPLTEVKSFTVGTTKETGILRRNGKLSNLHRDSITSALKTGFLRMVSQPGNNSITTMLNNGKILYARKNDDSLYEKHKNGYGLPIRELVHLDIHGAGLLTDEKQKVDNALAQPEASAIKSKVNEAWDDFKYIADKKGIIRSQTFINSGTTVIEGKKVAFSNSYDHSDNIISPAEKNTKSIATVINTGNITIHPMDTGTTKLDTDAAVFVVSPEMAGPNKNDSTKINGIPQLLYNSGKISTYNKKSAVFFINPDGFERFNNLTARRDITIVNRKGDIDIYGEKSVGVYIKTPNYVRQLNLDFSDTQTSAGNFSPMTLYGDKGVGLYIEKIEDSKDTSQLTPSPIVPTSIKSATKNNTSVVYGNFAVNIGNKTNSKSKNNDYTSGNKISMSSPVSPNWDSTEGVSGTLFSLNDGNEEIKGNYGIFSNYNIDFSDDTVSTRIGINKFGHEINIYGNTRENIGVLTGNGAEYKLGKGSINVLATDKSSKNSFDNTGIVVGGNNDAKGTVYGDVVRVTGTSDKSDRGNRAITAVDENNSVTVNAVESNDAINSITLVANNKAKITVNDTTSTPTIIGSSGVSTKAGVNISGSIFKYDSTRVKSKTDLNSSDNVGAAYANKDAEITINRTSRPLPANIAITGGKDHDDNYVGFGLFANNRGKINAKYNSIKADNASTAVASLNKGNIDLTGAQVEFNGEGYALYTGIDQSSADFKNAVYSDTGKIDLTSGKLVLGKSAIGYINDQALSSTPSITFNNTKIHVTSDDVIIADLKNSNGQIVVNVDTPGTNVLKEKLLGTGIGDVTSDTGIDKYKYAVVDNAKINIKKDIDKTIVAATIPDDDIFTRRFLYQNSIINVDKGITVKAELNTNRLGEIDSKLRTPIGLAVTASTKSKNTTTTGINNEGTISSARTDSGQGGIGLYVDYGFINNKDTGVINIEKALTIPNKKGIGMFGTNSTDVINKGKVNVSGEKAIGILGLSYRIDSYGKVVDPEDEPYYKSVRDAAPAAGKPLNGLFGNVNIENSDSGEITMDNDSAVGMFVKNNSNDEVSAGVFAVNDPDNRKTKDETIGVNKGTITINGGNGSVGMGADNGKITNDKNTAPAAPGKINVVGTKSAGMYGTNNSELINNGIINVAATSVGSESIGMFINDKDSTIKNAGTINVGKHSYGIYGRKVNMTGGLIDVDDDGVGVYSTGPNVSLSAGTINVADNNAVGVYVADEITKFATTPRTPINVESGVEMKVGDTDSFGYLITATQAKTDLTIKPTTNPVHIGEKSVYVYSQAPQSLGGKIVNKSDIKTDKKNGYGIYSSQDSENYGNIDLRSDVGNIGVYSTQGVGKNFGTINVGPSDVINKFYGIGIATGYYNEATKVTTNMGTVENHGTINVTNQNSVGMYAVGRNSKAVNAAGGVINLSGNSTTGMYIDQGGTGENWGTIQTTPTGAGTGIKGVVVTNGGIFKNYGTINIVGSKNMGVYVYKGSEGLGPATYEEHGTGNTSTVPFFNGTSTDQKVTGKAIVKVPPASLPSQVSISIDGVSVEPIRVDTNIASPKAPEVLITDLSGVTTLNLATEHMDHDHTDSNAEITELGMYVDTSGINYTKPFKGIENLNGLTSIDLIMGTEVTKYLNGKAIQIGNNILKPYNEAIGNVVSTGAVLNINSSSLTWIAQPVKSGDFFSPIKTVYMVKVPYTDFASEKDLDTYNFLDGLEQRYGVEGIHSREKQIFNKLNDLRKAEPHIFAQAVNEMKGYEYSNTQNRIYSTGNTLDKEFNYLRKDWRNPSKQNNKIKVFGMKDEYRTDTAGVINYDNNAYGVAYVHEDETVKLGNSSGWYAGTDTNRFRFKDLEKSREDQTMIKAGIFKTMSPEKDYNGALRWTVAADIFGGINDMHRKYWVVDDSFEAKSRYYSYGAALKNELGYDIRLSERAHLRPYGALKMEYGRFSDIKEDRGQMKLEINGNDYFSVKPEVGMEFKYIQPLAVRTKLSVGLTAAYENEIGKLNKLNQARVRYTTADWYNLRNEKEDRKGSGKFDLNIGIDNTRFGVTLNAGYDTKGENIRGGIGFRAIY